MRAKWNTREGNTDDMDERDGSGDSTHTAEWYKLNGARHKDPKTARRLKRAGTKGKQMRVYRAMKGSSQMPRTITENKKRHQLDMQFTDNEWAHILYARGSRSWQEFIIDASTASSIALDKDTEHIMRRLVAIRDLLGIDTVANTVERIYEGYQRATKRAERIKELESLLTASTENCAKIEKERMELHRQLDKCNGDAIRVSTKILRMEGEQNAVEPAPQSLLSDGEALEFIGAFRGTQLIVSDSGDMQVLSYPDNVVQRLFALWMRVRGKVG